MMAIDEAIHAEQEMGIDLIPCGSALDLLDGDIVTVLNEFWRRNDGVGLAG